jgi:hypothetical protein
VVDRSFCASIGAVGLRSLSNGSASAQYSVESHGQESDLVARRSLVMPEEGHASGDVAVPSSSMLV